MISPSKINPRLSAYNQLWGISNFGKTLFSPPGCKVIVNTCPKEIFTWADHIVVGFYIVPEMHHVRNYYCYIPNKRGDRVSNTVEPFPAHLYIPKQLLEDRLTQVTQDFITVIKNPHPKTLFLDQ